MSQKPQHSPPSLLRLKFPLALALAVCLASPLPFVKPSLAQDKTLSDSASTNDSGTYLIARGGGHGGGGGGGGHGGGGDGGGGRGGRGGDHDGGGGRGSRGSDHNGGNRGSTGNSRDSGHKDSKRDSAHKAGSPSRTQTNDDW